MDDEKLRRYTCCTDEVNQSCIEEKNKQKMENETEIKKSITKGNKKVKSMKLMGLIKKKVKKDF